MMRSLPIALVLCTGCLVDQLDPPPSGVFACIDDVDCPDGQSCLFELCQEGTVPTLEIRAPEPRQVIGSFTPGEDNPATIEFTAFVGGRDLELVSESTPARVGEGIIEVFVDDETAPQATLTAGSLTSGVPVELTIPNTPGAHRVRARALLTDGRPYPNDGAIVTGLSWIDDGNAHVAIESPAPLTAFGVDDVATQITITALNFEFRQALNMQAPGNVGHAHVHYDELFPSCIDVPACDNGYLGVVAPSQGGSFTDATIEIVLPASGEGLFNLTAILRHTNHNVFRGDDGTLPPVFEEVQIERDASVESAPMEDQG